MIVLPDEYLERVNCYTCGKFLSLPPIKRYDDGRTVCGRCNRPGDDGIICDEGAFAAQGYFKCINRFDGCRQVVPFGKVPLHEVWCRSRTYACPACPPRTRPLDVFTFYMVKHFETDHAEYLLESDTFTVDVGRIESRTRLHRVADNLFFVECKVLNEYAFRLNALFLGDKRADGMTQQYTVQLGGKRFETDIKPTCNVGDDSDCGGIVVHHTVPQGAQGKTAIVTVHVTLGDLETVLASIPSMLFPRRVALVDTHGMTFTVDPDSSAVVAAIGPTKQFKMYCVNCASVPENQKYFVTFRPGFFHAICDVCRWFLLRLSPKTLVIPAENALPEIERLTLGFSCIWSNWGCTSFLRRDELNRHEVACTFQVPQVCPMPHCTYFGTLFLLQSHFAADHRMVCLHLDGTYLQFRRPTTPYPLQMIVWANYGFIAFKISQDEAKNQYSIGLEQPKEVETFGRLKPKIITLESDAITQNLRATLLESNSESTFAIGNHVSVKCYFSV